MGIDSTDVTLLETKIAADLTGDPKTSIQDATGNRVEYQRPPLNLLTQTYDWLKARTGRNARTSMFDKFRFIGKN
jgi:hypothetical protein